MNKKQPRKAPAPEKVPEPSALERMRELARRIVQVPESELPKVTLLPDRRRTV